MYLLQAECAIIFEALRTNGSGLDPDPSQSFYWIMPKLNMVSMLQLSSVEFLTYLLDLEFHICGFSGLYCLVPKIIHEETQPESCSTRNRCPLEL